MAFTISVSSLGELITQVTEICGKPPHNMVWYRGHEVADWKLEPRIQREYSLDIESRFASAFQLEAPLRYEKVPGQTEYSRWLPLMQHYRLPTRLLDWTKSPLVAAYFAINHTRDNDSAIWGLFPKRLNEIEASTASVYSIAHNDILPFVLSAFDLVATPDGVRAVMAETTDIRMLVQQAMFTIHGIDKPLDDKYNDNDEVLIKFLLPKRSHDRMYAELDHCGVTRSHLFPDLENLALSLTSRGKGYNQQQR